MAVAHVKANLSRPNPQSEKVRRHCRQIVGERGAFEMHA